MAFTYDAGLRIRPPEPMPDCLEGESAQDYFSRVMAQSSIESATTAENTSGDSAPTPFNIGQVQSDLAQLQEDVGELEDSVADLTTKVNGIIDGYVTGIETYAVGDVLSIVALPSSGIWRICGITPVTTPMAGLFVSDVVATSFSVNFTAATDVGSFHWCARKVT